MEDGEEMEETQALKNENLVKISLGRDTDVVVMNFGMKINQVSLNPTDAINVADKLRDLAEEILLSDA